MNLSRQPRSCLLLLCLALMPAVEARSIAADAAPAPPRAAASAPVRPQPAAPPRSPLQTLTDALGTLVPRAQPAAAPAGPAGPRAAAARRSPIQAMADALGDVEDQNLRQRLADDPNVRNLEGQFRPQFQQMLYVELAFLRRVCKVDTKAFAEIAGAAKRGLRGTLREYVVAQYARMRQGPRSTTDAPDPRVQMYNLLTPIVEAKLGPPQARGYREECDKRAESRKRAVVLNLIAALDERLVLTADQRAKLVQSLSANYETAWDYNLQIFAYNVQYLPAIRDTSIMPVLNEKQQGVWLQIPKRSSNSFWGFPVVHMGVPNQPAEIQEIARIVAEAPDE